MKPCSRKFMVIRLTSFMKPLTWWFMSQNLTSCDMHTPYKDANGTLPSK